MRVVAVPVVLHPEILADRISQALLRPPERPPKVRPAIDPEALRRRQGAPGRLQAGGPRAPRPTPTRPEVFGAEAGRNKSRLARRRPVQMGAASDGSSDLRE